MNPTTKKSDGDTGSVEKKHEEEKLTPEELKQRKDEETLRRAVRDELNKLIEEREEHKFGGQKQMGKLITGSVPSNNI